jgi:lysozyme family protein
MSVSSRHYCMQTILDMEGGYVNDPRDPGGETRFGISKRAHPNEDIKTLTKERATELYLRDYWVPVSADKLRAGIDLMAFDCAVNQGVKTAIKLLQQASGVTIDGSIGPRTLAGQAMPGVLAKYAALRAMRYTNTDEWNVYGTGWINRLFRVFEISVGMQ